MDASRTKRIDIVSDTHGRLTDRLLAAIEGCDVLIHAGDITSEEDYAELAALVPELHAVRGNNDGYYYEYPPEVDRLAIFVYEGLRFAVAHYRDELPLGSCDVAVCGHTHRANIERVGRCLVINPGSATLPRGMRGPTIARLLVDDGAVVSCEIIDL